MHNWKRVCAGLSAAALLAVSLSACGDASAEIRDASAPLSDGEEFQISDTIDLHDVVEIAPANVPLAIANPVINGVLEPAASGVAVYENEYATLDASNADQGYVMVKYAAGETARIKVQITRSGGTTYTYDLEADGAYDVFPLPQGDGAYQVNVFRNISGTKYAQVFGQSVQVSLTNELLPFLYPNQYVDFNASSRVVSVADEITASASDELDTVAAVYEYVVQNIRYDYDLAKNVPSTYLPDLDAVLSRQTGICFDYASVMTAMLRAKGIPTKLVIGYTSRGEYHAWISTHVSQIGWINNVISFDGKSWKLMDPTFASTGKQSQQIMDYINNPANYTEKYCY